MERRREASASSPDRKYTHAQIGLCSRESSISSFLLFPFFFFLFSFFHFFFFHFYLCRKITNVSLSSRMHGLPLSLSFSLFLCFSLSLSLCEYPSRCGCGRCTRGYFNQACLFNGCNAAFICPPFSSCLRAPLSKLHFILALQIVTGVKKRPAFDRSSPPSFESHGKRSVV